MFGGSLSFKIVEGTVEIMPGVTVPDGLSVDEVTAR